MRFFTTEMTRAAIRHILEQEKRSPHPERWSAQGFGMLRMYLDNEKVFRLNVWDDRLAVPNVSIIHDHPWHFESLIISGFFENRRYREDKNPGHPQRGISEEYSYATIVTGEGGGPIESSRTMWLYRCTKECYLPGDAYQQQADEVHASYYNCGTVTLNRRIPVSRESHARVFWPVGGQWVNAMPRPATVHEIDMVLSNALARWEE